MGENTGTLLLDFHYLPCIAYFSYISHYQKVTLDVHENYVKQSYRNRCCILSANKVLPLSVPVHRGTGKKLTRDVKIDYSQKWVNNHWRAIRSAYGNAPFFEFYADRLHDILYKKFPFLIDLNWELLTYCLEGLQIDKHKFSYSIGYQKDPGSGIYDGRNQIQPNYPTLIDRFFEANPYEQVFGKNFVSNMSTLDLLFCMGPGARSYVINSSGTISEQQKLQGR